MLHKAVHDMRISLFLNQVPHENSETMIRANQSCSVLSIACKYWAWKVYSFYYFITIDKLTCFQINLNRIYFIRIPEAINLEMILQVYGESCFTGGREERPCPSHQWRRHSSRPWPASPGYRVHQGRWGCQQPRGFCQRVRVCSVRGPPKPAGSFRGPVPKGHRQPWANDGSKDGPRKGRGLVAEAERRTSSQQRNSGHFCRANFYALLFKNEILLL